MASVQNIFLNASGGELWYAVEATAGVRPTALGDYITDLEQITSIPSMESAPNNIESPPLKETIQIHARPGLRPAPEAYEFPFNAADSSLQAWNDMVTAYEGLTGGKVLWFCVTHPDITNAWFFPGIPSRLDLPEMTPNSPFIATGYITPTGPRVTAAKPTI